jgi:hypothetical protein
VRPALIANGFERLQKSFKKFGKLDIVFVRRYQRRHARKRSSSPVMMVTESKIILAREKALTAAEALTALAVAADKGRRQVREEDGEED